MTRSKDMLNNLYGKMASSDNSSHARKFNDLNVLASCENFIYADTDSIHLKLECAGMGKEQNKPLLNEDMK